MKELTNPLIQHVRLDIPRRFNELTLFGQHRDRLTRVLGGETLPPYEIIVHPSSRCNLQCAWCIGEEILDERDLSKASDRLPSTLEDPDKMARVIDGIVNYEKDGFRVENVSFSGITGEPFMAKQSFVKAVKILTKHGVRVGVFSNSTLIDPDIQNALLKISYINVSLDAATPVTWANMKYRGKSAGYELFDRVIQNVGNLTRARDKSGSDLQVNASFVLYPDNYPEIYEAARLCKGMGVNTLRIKQDISGISLLSPGQREEAVKLCARVQSDLVDDRFRFVEIHPPDTAPKSQRSFNQCLITNLWGAVGSDGKVYACNYNACVGGVPPYGNAIEQSFQEIWEGETRRRIQQQLPMGCPQECDPFKGRANRLLSAVQESYQTNGPEITDLYIDELLRQLHD